MQKGKHANANTLLFKNEQLELECWFVLCYYVGKQNR